MSFVSQLKVKQFTKHRNVLEMDQEDPWIQTVSGTSYHFLNPWGDKIVINDVAHALSLQCRFGGHTKRFYSVGEHSVEVSNRTPGSAMMKLHGLMHDASEAFLSDMVSPLKLAFPRYYRLEAKCMDYIYCTFNLPYYPTLDEVDVVREVDRRMLKTEQDRLLPPCSQPRTTDDVKPYDVGLLRCLSPEKAKAEFLRLYFNLRGQL